jgi:hypothetical protein
MILGGTTHRIIAFSNLAEPEQPNSVEGIYISDLYSFSNTGIS